MLHYASYPTTDVNNLIASNFFASLLAIAIAFMMHTLIPNKAEPSAPPVAPEKSSNRVRHEAILGATVTTLSFLVFQLFDLQDSISAQATTILVLLALFFVGGQLIHGFATALLFGVFVGTYSSIFVASSVALSLGVSRDDLMPTEVEKEGADQDPLQ